MRAILAEMFCQESSAKYNATKSQPFTKGLGQKLFQSLERITRRLHATPSRIHKSTGGHIESQCPLLLSLPPFTVINIEKSHYFQTFSNSCNFLFARQGFLLVVGLIGLQKLSLLVMMIIFLTMFSGFRNLHFPPTPANNSNKIKLFPNIKLIFIAIKIFINIQSECFV